MDNFNKIALEIIQGKDNEVVTDKFVERIDRDADELLRLVAHNSDGEVAKWLEQRLDDAIRDAAELADAADALVALEDRPLPTSVRLEDAA